MIDVDKLEAGPELDALIAEKVMGLVKDRSVGFGDDGHEAWFLKGGPKVSDFSPPKYSTEIGAAWAIVEKLRLSVAPYDVGPHRWMAAPHSYFADWETHSAETAPLAICRAALKAVGA